MVPKNKTDRIGQLAEKAFKEAVKDAIAEHRRMGIPAVFMRSGQIVYLMPDGRVVEKLSIRKTAKK